MSSFCDEFWSNFVIFYLYPAVGYFISVALTNTLCMSVCLYVWEIHTHTHFSLITCMIILYVFVIIYCMCLCASARAKMYRHSWCSLFPKFDLLWLFWLKCQRITIHSFYARIFRTEASSNLLRNVAWYKHNCKSNVYIFLNSPVEGGCKWAKWWSSMLPRWRDDLFSNWLSNE